MNAPLVRPAMTESENLRRENLVELVFAKATKITNFLVDKGLNARPTGAHVGATIFEVVESKIERILSDLTFLESIIRSPLSFKKTDVELTQEVLKTLSLTVDKDFWTTVHADDVIELYRDDGVQIFRSFNMFKTTGYSLLDLNLYSWDELWERSSYSTTQIAEAVQDILTGKQKVISFNLREDIIKEILNSKLTEPFEPRTLSVKLGHITALRSFDTQVIRGFAVTTRCRILSVGKASENLSFI